MDGGELSVARLLLSPPLSNRMTMDGRRKRSERRAVATRRPGLAAKPSQTNGWRLFCVCVIGGNVASCKERRRAMIPKILVGVMDRSLMFHVCRYEYPVW